MRKPKSDYARDTQGNFKSIGDMIKSTMTVLQYGRWLAQQQKSAQA